METTTSKRRVGPFSRAITRGAIGASLNGRSPEGKFLRRVEAELIAQLGHEPSFSERLLLTRAARAALRLEIFDERLAAGGEITTSEGKVYGALNTTLRMAIRELGLKGGPIAPKTPTVAEIAARYTK